MRRKWVIDVCRTCGSHAVYPFCEHRRDGRWYVPIVVTGTIPGAALEGTDQPKETDHLHKFGEHGTCVCGETPPCGAALEGTDQ